MAAPTAPAAPHAPPERPPILALLRRWLGPLVLPLGSIVIAFVAGGLVVALSGGNPFDAYSALVCGGTGLFCPDRISPARQISETLVAAIPLVLAGLAVGFSFRGGLFNIGAQGQLIMGAVAANVIGVKLGFLPNVALIPLVLIGGALAGALWGGIVGALKAFTGAHEVVTTIMLNYVAGLFVKFLVVSGPFELKSLPSNSPSISDSAKLPRLVPQSPGYEFLGQPGASFRIHAGVFISILAAVVFWFILRRMALGYEIRAVGQSQRAARYAGVSVKRTILVTMLIAGALAGLAGAVQISGLQYSLTGNAYDTDTTGFDAIAVTLLGQNTATGIILSALLFGALHIGGQLMQGLADVPGNLVDILQAFILFSIAANFLRTVRLPDFMRRAPGATTPTVEPVIAAMGESGAADNDVQPGVKG